MQWIQVQSLIQEDRTCRKQLSLGTTSPEPMQLLRTCALQQEKPLHHHKREVPVRCNWRKPVYSSKDPVQPKKKEFRNLKTRVKNGLSSASTSMKPHRHLQNLRNACMKPSPLTNTGLFPPFLLERRKLRPSRVKRFAQDHTSRGRKMRTKSSSFHLLR